MPYPYTGNDLYVSAWSNNQVTTTTARAWELEQIGYTIIEPPVFEITAINDFDDSAINEFSANVSGSGFNISARTTSGVIEFDELNDMSGNNNTLTNNGAVYNSSIGAMEFTGDTNFLSTDFGSFPNNQDYSFITVLKINGYPSGSSETSLLTVKPDAGTLRGVGLQLGDTPSIIKFISRNNSGVSFINGITPVIGEVYTVMGIYDYSSQTMSLYINENLTGTSPLSYVFQTSSFLKIGTNGVSGSGGQLNGTVYLNAIYSKALNASERGDILEGLSEGNLVDLNSLFAYYPFQRIGNNATVNATVYKENWFLTDSRNNYNTSSLLEAQLAEAQISLSAKSLITNATVTLANFTIEGQTFSDGELINISAGDYNVTFSKSGWYNLTREITVVADASQSFVIDNVYNAIANISYRDSQLNQTVNDYNLIVTQSSYTQDYSINNQSSYEVPLLNNLQYNFEFINSSYFTTSEFVNINSTYSNYTFYVTEVGDIEIFIYDLNTTNLITSNVNLLVQNSTNEVNYTITSGNGFIEDLVVGSEYNLQFSAIGYETNNYVFTYTNQSSIDLFMNANYEDITFLTQNSASSPLQGTNVQVERFFNGSYEVISVGNTDIIGEFVSNLQAGLTHRITFSKSGFTTQSFITQLTQNTYTITMQPVSVFDYSQGLDGVSSVVTPQNNTLFPTTVNFTVLISDENENLEYYFARLYYNGSILVFDNETASTGGTLTFLYDVSSFNNSGIPLLLEYGYATSDSGVINRYKAYAVSSDENYAGSLLQLRDRMSEKLTLLEKLSIFAFVFILLLLMFSTLVQGVINVIISSGLALIIGWIVGINLIILITMFVLSVVIVMAFGSRDL